MPELPEVETVRRGLEPQILGKRFASVTVRESRLRWPVPADLALRVVGRRIESVDRRGKYILMGLDSGDRLLLHLGMSGRMRVLTEPLALVKHDHVDLQMQDGPLLRYNDPRRFGALLLWNAGDAVHPLLADMGPEPFSEAFTGDYLWERSRGRQSPVKTFIMDGHIVVGAGNIYAAESLFRAGIRPDRAAGSVSRKQYTALAGHIRDVLSEAIAQGGTTLRDFVGANGQSGYFQQDLWVYGRDGEPCRRCQTVLKRSVIGQRASVWCPRCQR